VGRWRFLLVLAVLAAVVATAAGAHPRPIQHSDGYPGPRLTVVEGVSVYASLLADRTPAATCPRRPLPLTPGLVRAGAHAVALAMLALYAHAKEQGHPRIDARGAIAQAAPSLTADQGTAFRAFCGATVWRRSILVAVQLPRVTFSASLSQASCQVARTRLGWVIWAEVH
jgi:hypothetical protein